MPRDPETDRDVLEKAKPYIRSIAAFLLYLRFGTPMAEEIPGAKKYGITDAQATADTFIADLERDMDQVEPS